MTEQISQPPQSPPPSPIAHRDKGNTALIWIALISIIALPVMTIPYMRARRSFILLQRDVEHLIQLANTRPSPGKGVESGISSILSTLKRQERQLLDLGASQTQILAGIANMRHQSAAQASMAGKEANLAERKSGKDTKAIMRELKALHSLHMQNVQTSRQLFETAGTSLATVAAFMDEIETTIGMPRVGDDPRGIERLRRAALALNMMPPTKPAATTSDVHEPLPWDPSPIRSSAENTSDSQGTAESDMSPWGQD